MCRCFFCGHECFWQSNADAEKVGYSCEGIVTFYTCSHCKAEYEVMIPTDKTKDETS